MQYVSMYTISTVPRYFLTIHLHFYVVLTTVTVTTRVLTTVTVPTTRCLLTTVSVDVVTDSKSLVKRVKYRRFVQITHRSKVVLHRQDVGVSEGRHRTLVVLQRDS